MAEEKTVRMTLRRSVGRGGKYYGPGECDVPESLAKALQTNASASVSGDDAAADDSSSIAGDESTSRESGTEKREAKPATKAALKEYGDADKLRELASAKGVRVKKDATKADIVDALHDAEVSLDE